MAQECIELETVMGEGGDLGMELWNLRLEHMKKRQTERRGNGGRADSLGNMSAAQT